MIRKYRVILILLCILLLIAGAYSSMNNSAPERHAIWKFAVISDTQGDNRDKNIKSCINDEILNSIAADIAVEKPDIVLVSGDLVNGWFRNGGTDYASQYTNWKKAMKPVFNMGIKVFAVRGNHDSGPERLVLPPLPKHLEPQSGSLAMLEKAFRNAVIGPSIPLNGPENEKGITYCIIHKNACIIGLDQYAGGQHEINQKWLERQLSNNTRIHLFVFGHEPAFETNHKDNLSFYPLKRDRFWDSIGKAGGRIYFCGHDHFYNRSLIKDSMGNPVWQIIGGTGGGRLRQWSGSYKESKRVMGEYHNDDFHGYILVTVDGQKVTVEWKALVNASANKWHIYDAYSYSVSSVKTH